MDMFTAALFGILYVFFVIVLFGVLAAYIVLAIHTNKSMLALLEEAINSPSVLDQLQKENYIKSLRSSIPSMFAAKITLMCVAAIISYILGSQFFILVSFVCVCFAFNDFYRYLKIKTAQKV